MKQVLSLILFIITVSSIFCSCHKKEDDPPLKQAKWEAVNLNYTGDIDYIFALPNDTIMLISRFDDNYQKTCIFESDDGARTWKQNCFDMLIPSGFAGMYCFNHMKIFSQGFQTFDGGNSWQQQGFRGTPWIFISTEVGFYGIGSSIYKTTDGGMSAKLVFDSHTYEGFQFMQFFDNNIGYSSGGACWDSYNTGIIIKTTDGGDTWHQLPEKFKSIIGMSFISVNIGYVVINLHEGNVAWAWKDGAELLKTTDGGDTWTSVNDKIYDEFNIIPIQCYFSDEQHGFLCGSGNESKILATSDGGRTWKEEYTGTSSNYLLNRMIFSSSGTGYAVGNKGILLKRTIY